MHHHFAREMYNKCKMYKDCHVVLQTSERALLEGVLLELDEDNATLLLAEDLDIPESSYGELRQNNETFRPRYRRYKKVKVPIVTLTAVYLFPYYYPYFPNIYQRNTSYRY